MSGEGKQEAGTQAGAAAAYGAHLSREDLCHLLGVAADLAHHPLGRLRDAGVAVTLATDDPGYFANTVTDELLAQRAHQSTGEGLDFVEVVLVR